MKQHRPYDTNYKYTKVINENIYDYNFYNYTTYYQIIYNHDRQNYIMPKTLYIYKTKMVLTLYIFNKFIFV